MDTRTSWMIVAAGLALGLSAGCTDWASSSPVQSLSTETPIGIQMQHADPELAGRRFNNLLSFESATDPVFITASQLHVEMDGSRAHTGHASLRLTGDGGKLTVKLASLLSAQQFLDNWTFAGAYFYSEKPARIAVSLDTFEPSQKIVDIPAGQWTPVTIDLPDPKSPQGQPIAAIPSLSFVISASGDVWCDDVMLIDNTQWIVGLPQSAVAGQWNVYRHGSNIICGGKDFHLELAAETKPDGWTIEEANAFRLRLKSTSSSSANQFLTIYSDGRSYVNGNFRPLAASMRSDTSWTAQQMSPAEIQVPETMGRIDRNSPGDDDNDGYNENRAAYMITASGPRLEATISPRSVPIVQPLLEITGLPPGEVLVTIEGRLVEKTLRFADGRLLIELPGRIDRPTTVNVRVQ